MGDYSGEEWPEGGMESLEQGVGTDQFYGSPDQFENKSSLNQGLGYDHGSNNGVGFAQRTNFPNMRGFGRGAAAFRGAQRAAAPLPNPLILGKLVLCANP